MMRSGNPALRANTFREARADGSSAVMTIEGTVNKTLILLFLAVFAASWVWSNPLRFLPFMFPAIICGFIVAMVTIFKKEWAGITAPIYALVQGVFLGVISALLSKNIREL